MKAVQFSRFGVGAEVAEVVELPDPGMPGPGEVTIDVLAGPINPSNLLNFAGRYGATPPPLPSFAGGEAVGRIAAVGDGVTHLKVGDHVLALFAGRDSWRQRMRARADGLFALPPGGDVQQLSMLAVNPATAWHMLHRFVELKPGDWVLQNAGNSGVGQNAIRLARRMGVRSVSLVRREEQVAPLKALCGDVVLVDGPDLPARVAAATGGVPVRLAFDAVAGEATGRLVASVGPGGIVVIYGVQSGDAAHINAADVLFRDVSVRGFWFSVWFREASTAERKALYDHLTPLVVDGTIHVPVEATYPLERVREALAHAARAHRGGKILLTMNP